MEEVFKKLKHLLALGHLRHIQITTNVTKYTQMQVTINLDPA